MKSEDKVKVFKALSDLNRVKIIEILSCGELCGCKILENLHITQPTLSHHMKILIDAGLVSSRKEINWVHYSINKETIIEVNNTFNCCLEVM